MPISERRTDVFIFNVDCFVWEAENMQLAMSLLTAEERLARQRLIGTLQSTVALCSRALLRRVLGWALGEDGQGLQLEAGEYGKPRLTRHCDPPIHFNVSHSGTFVAVMVDSHRECGIDIESTDANYEDSTAYLLRFLPRDEQVILAEARPEAILEHWSVKEAYLKALGFGLVRELDSFWVKRNVQHSIDGWSSWLVEDLHDDQNEKIALASRRSPNFCLAIALEGCDPGQLREQVKLWTIPASAAIHSVQVPSTLTTTEFPWKESI